MATRAPFVGPGRQQSFALQVGAWADKARGNAEQVVRKVGFEMFARVVQRTPVDTGRARGNWQVTLVTPASAVVDRSDGGKKGSRPSGSLESSALAATEGYSIKVAQTIWITNGLPYAPRLEYGWSSQAPAGMVRVTVAEFQGLVSALAGQVKR